MNEMGVTIRLAKRFARGTVRRLFRFNAERAWRRVKRIAVESSYFADLAPNAFHRAVEPLRRLGGTKRNASAPGWTGPAVGAETRPRPISYARMR